MIKKLVSHLGEYKRAAILTPIFSALEAIMDVMLPTIMAFIIDQGIEKGDMNAVVKYGLLTFLVAAIALLLGVLAGRFAATASTGFAGNLRDAMYENIQHFVLQHRQVLHGRSGHPHDHRRDQPAERAPDDRARACPVHLVFALIMASMISRSLTMVFLVAIVFLVAVLAGIMVPTFGIFDKVFKNYDNLNASVQENVSAIRVVKSFVREHFENEKYTKACESLYKQFVHAESRLSFNNPAMLVSVYGCNIALSWFGAHYVLNGAITTGQLNALFGYIMNILMALMMLEHGLCDDRHVRRFCPPYRGSAGRDHRPAPGKAAGAAGQGWRHRVRARHLQVQARLRPACPERCHLPASGRARHWASSAAPAAQSPVWCS